MTKDIVSQCTGMLLFRSLRTISRVTRSVFACSTHFCEWSVYDGRIALCSWLGDNYYALVYCDVTPQFGKRAD